MPLCSSQRIDRARPGRMKMNRHLTNLLCTLTPCTLLAAPHGTAYDLDRSHSLCPPMQTCLYRAFFQNHEGVHHWGPSGPQHSLGGRQPSSRRHGRSRLSIVSGSMCHTFRLVGEQRFEASVARNRVPINSHRALLSLTVCASRLAGALPARRAHERLPLSPATRQPLTAAS